MRPSVVLMTTLLASTAWAAEILDNVESPVYDADGTHQQIAGKAQTCAARELRFDAATGKDATAAVISPGIASSSSGQQQASGGSVLSHVDLEAGVVVANQRAQTGGLMGGDYLQSTVTIEARDGRFRITHTGIARMPKDSGYMENPGFQPVYIQAFSGSEKVRKQLLAISDELANCIKAQPADW